MRNRTCIIAVLLSLAAFGAKAGLPASIEIVTEELPPFNYTENGKITGWSTEIVQAVLDEIHIQGRFTSIPWARAMSIARERPNVLIYSMVRTPERDKYYKWVGVLNRDRIFLYCLAERDLKLHSLDDARIYRLGTVYHDFREEYLRSHGFIEGDNMESTNSNELNYVKLKAGRIDLWPTYAAVMTHVVGRAGDDPQKMVKPAMEMTELEAASENFMAFGKETPDEVVEAFRRGLERIKANGVYAVIAHKWAP